MYDTTIDQSQRDTDAGMMARIFAEPDEYIDDLAILASV